MNDATTTPRPAGEPDYSKLFSTTEGFTLWDQQPGSLDSGPTRFRLYTPGGCYLGAYCDPEKGERFAAELATEFRPRSPDAMRELVEAATAAKDELAIAGRYAEPVCTRLEAALKVMPAAWSEGLGNTSDSYLARFPEDQRATADRAYQDGFADGANSEGEEEDNAAQLRRLIANGLTFGEALNVFGEHQRQHSPELTPYSEAVDSVLPDEASFDSDDTPIVSKGDDAGAYVLVWAWVSDEDAGVFTLIEIEHFDEDPDGDEDRAGDGYYYRKVGDEGWSGAWHSEDEAKTEAENEYGPVKVKGEPDAEPENQRLFSAFRAYR